MGKKNESEINISNEEEDRIQRRNRAQMESRIKNFVNLFPDYKDVNVILEGIISGKKE